MWSPRQPEPLWSPRNHGWTSARLRATCPRAPVSSLSSLSINRSQIRVRGPRESDTILAVTIFVSSTGTAVTPPQILAVSTSAWTPLSGRSRRIAAAAIRSPRRRQMIAPKVGLLRCTPPSSFSLSLSLSRWLLVMKIFCSVYNISAFIKTLKLKTFF